MLRKLEKYGIRGVALKLIQSYLEKRYQYVSMSVCINNWSSSKLEVQQGPQGSILGPLLFIYINDVTAIHGSPQLIMYADDTNVFFTGETIQCLETSVNDYLLQLSACLYGNCLSLNINKSTSFLSQLINVTATHYF